MRLLEERILSEAEILPGNVLKVDMFLNHQIDYALLREMGREFYRLFAADKVTKILTAEASGIALACAAAEFFKVPVVFAKKGQHKNIGSDFFKAEVYSYTKACEYTMLVSKKYINKDDYILIIDDFLANGAALAGLISIISQSSANLTGVGIAIEKAFQGGGEKFRKQDIKLISLAMIESMENGDITFKNQS